MEKIDTSVRAEQTGPLALGRSLVHAGQKYMQNIKPSVRGQQAWARSGNEQRPRRPWMVAVWGRSRPVGGLTRASRSGYGVLAASTVPRRHVLPYCCTGSLCRGRLNSVAGGRCGKEPRKQCGRETRTSALRNEAYWPATRGLETRLSGATSTADRRSARSQCC